MDARAAATSHRWQQAGDEAGDEGRPAGHFGDDGVLAFGVRVCADRAEAVESGDADPGGEVAVGRTTDTDRARLLGQLKASVVGQRKPMVVLKDPAGREVSRFASMLPRGKYRGYRTAFTDADHDGLLDSLVVNARTQAGKLVRRVVFMSVDKLP